MRPLLLLDVDGVLNPFAAKATRRPEGYTTHRLVPTGWNPRKPLRVWLNPGHGPALLRLADATGAELVWATTWEADANTMIGPVLGLPELPVITFGFTPANRDSWKFPAVSEYAGLRPLVWLDDDFHTQNRRFVNSKAMFMALRGNAPTLLHHVDPRIGLTELDFAAVGRWLTRQEAA